jgi:hypothetical protein
VSDVQRARLELAELEDLVNVAARAMPGPQKLVALALWRKLEHVLLEILAAAEASR